MFLFFVRLCIAAFYAKKTAFNTNKYTPVALTPVLKVALQSVHWNTLCQTIESVGLP